MLTFVCLVSYAIAVPALTACPATGGGFVNDPSDCAKYFSCVEGFQISQTCPTPLVFNIADSTCAPKDVVGCQLCPLTGVSRVMRNDSWILLIMWLSWWIDLILQVADATACDKYILCVEGVESPKTCGVGDHFNPTTLDCDLPTNLTPPCAIVSNACATATPDAPFVADPSVIDCTKYLVCSNKVQVGLAKTCAVGLFFDAVGQRCSSKFVCPP